MNTKSFNNNQHLSYEDLLAYHSGNLSNKEMHRLELHLIDCELCNNALAGIANIEEVELEKHLSNIKIKTGTKAEASISTKHILAIAATIILLAVVSVVLLNNKNEPPLVAEHLPEKKIEEPIRKETPISESTAIQDTSVLGAEQSIPKESAPPEQEDPPIITEPALASQENQPVQNEENITLDMEDITLAEVINEDNPDSLITIANTEAGEEETILASQQPVAVRTEQDKAAARSKKVASVSESEGQGLQEVVITDSNYKPAAPIKGKRSYNRYLKRSLQYPTAAKENNIEGNVLLQVIINAEGIISDIKIIESLGFGCDQEAIRLVRDGPKWKAGQQDGLSISDTVNVTVTFKL